MPQYWFIVEALLALAAHPKAAAKAFTRAELRSWSQRLKERPTGVQQALDHLQRCGMVRRLAGAPSDQPLKPGTWRYRLTPEGAAAARAAADTHRHATLSAAGKKGNQARARSKTSYSARVWALLRMRRTLSAPEAAAVLTDVGDDVRKAANAASQYLRRWADSHPEAIQVSKQRGANGAHRYVLIKDLGPVAPIATPPNKARGGAAA